MCYATTCSSCQKKTWAGCGKHIDSALSGIAEQDRCAGWKTGKCPGPQPKTNIEISKDEL